MYLQYSFSARFFGLFDFYMYLYIISIFYITVMCYAIHNIRYIYNICKALYISYNIYTAHIYTYTSIIYVRHCTYRIIYTQHIYTYIPIIYVRHYTYRIIYTQHIYIHTSNLPGLNKAGSIKSFLLVRAIISILFRT